MVYTYPYAEGWRGVRMDIREAADRLNLSEATIRRWIKSGRLKAEMKNGHYGPQYFISETDLEKANEENQTPILIQNQATPAELERAMQQVIKAEIEKVEESLKQELDDLKSELNDTRAWQEERDQQIMRGLRSIQDRQEQRLQPLWRKLFKRK